MTQKSAGQILQEARERQGLDLTTVARRLRIRADILRAIEESDFSAMPPRGYTRNMVNAYARLLGLNPTDIVNKYLDEAYANQVTRARSTSRKRFDLGAADTRRSSRRAERSERSERGGGREERFESRRTALGRDLYDDRTDYALPSYGLASSGRSRGGRAADGEGDFRNRDRGARAPRATRHTAVSNPYTNLVSSPKAQSAISSRLPLIIGVAAALIVVVLVVWLAVSNARSQANDVPTAPISGISDTTGVEDASGEAPAPRQPATVEAPPTSAEVTYEVAGAGTACYVEEYTDGKRSNAETLTGPTSRKVSVTGTWSIATWVPDALSVKVNGKEVKLESSAQYGGMYACTVSFQDILDAWNKEHGREGAADASKPAAGGGAAASGAATGSAAGTQTGAAGTPGTAAGA
ncbi:helix-turn-helix domain-containing protein [Berryella wangjianweii]|uniref:Helix-turn-helix domain-containing protein n=1 Tax=Berryella wangjianweii TaxID=2734634 RepID=A0A6M8J2V3_9ACTN|nr:helix-turn-helix transcriptional regulator [Berryella wangjianweii]QKF06983.1 helix-turn-helix domain-containing protein [Berryella wangjianweii]